MCVVASLEDPASDEMDECAIPIFNELADAEFPGFIKPCFEETVRHARDRLIKTPGLTKQACHQINTVGSPARVPPRRIPAHFQQKFKSRYAEERESNSSWLAPAVYTRKKTEGIRLCAHGLPQGKHEDIKNAYPLPLIDKVQDCLSGVSKLDFQCG